MDWKIQYCYNVQTTQSGLQIQCNPHQNAIGFSNPTTEHVPKRHEHFVSKIHGLLCL